MTDIAETHEIVGREQWLAARKQLLVKEKAFTRARDALNQERRELPWEAVATDYVFDGPDGPEKLSQLFDGRSQLIVYHFMFGTQDEVGCPHCSFWADSFNNNVVHLNHRDASFVAISRAPYPKLAAYRQRLGWSFKWLSSGANSFNYDFGASFRREDLEPGKTPFNFGTLPAGLEDREGISVFYKDAQGRIYRTYSTHGRGIDLMNTAYNFIDLTPKGRDEGDRNQYWVRRHDEYDR
jgi:predicted dithiol-disulfide oxidoreductase (DUF899 family)